MSLRLRALVTVAMLVIGALAWSSASAASAGPSHRAVSKTVCDVMHCDAPAPDTCRMACPHAPRLAPESTSLTLQAPLLRDVDFAVTVSVASLLNLSERLDRPPR